MAVRLYHRRAPNFRGEVLYPLNRLKDVAADLHAAQAAKYGGREQIMEQRVPMLDCLWNDVLHLSPVHPARMKEACEAEGLEWWPADWFEIDPAAHGFDSANTAVFLYTDMTVETSIPLQEFASYSAQRVAEMCEVPQRHREYLREVKRTGEKHFIFAGVPHVLHRDALDVRRMTIIRV